MSFIREIFSNLRMRHQIIHHNKSCSNKYLCIENQVQEEETTKNVFNPRGWSYDASWPG